MSKINNRNPFTSISNYSFVRNLNKIESPQTRIKCSSYSSEKKYFDYNQSYMHEKFLNQQNYCKKPQKMTIENNYFQSEKPIKEIRSSRASKNQAVEEYYTLANYKNVENTSTSEFATNTNDFMKNSAIDMFGSDFFNKRSSNSQINRESFLHVIPQKRISNSNQHSHQFLLKNFQEKVVDQAEQSQSMEKSQQISEIQITTSFNENIPQTIFVKTKRKIFHLYHDNDKEDL